MFKRMNWHLKRVYLIWRASLGCFDSFTHVSWIFLFIFDHISRVCKEIMVFLYFLRIQTRKILLL
jgi:hypothetical protein